MAPIQVDQQLGLVADAVRGFRSAMETASIDASERRQIILKQGDDSLSLEDLLGWVDDLATNEGPRLISSSERFSTRTAIALAQHLSGFLRLIDHAAPATQATNESWLSPPVRDAVDNLQHSMLDLLHQIRQIRRT